MANIHTLRTPEDALIVDIADDGPVVQGQTLIRLRAPRVEMHRSALAALAEHIQIIERPFQDGRIDEELAMLVKKAELRRQIWDDAKRIYEATQAKHDLGVNSADDLDVARKALLEANDAALSAQLQASHGERKKLDLLDKIASAKNRLKREGEFLHLIEGALIVNAPCGGVFTARAARTSFLKRGQVFGGLETA